MKYMLTWNERPQGSPIECENAQKRILEVFTQWKAPSNKFCSMLPAFVFEARPVVPVMDAVRIELEAIAFRDELKNK
jgi:hypothetical protein